jgi:hypothetical protein
MPAQRGPDFRRSAGFGENPGVIVANSAIFLAEALIACSPHSQAGRAFPSSPQRVAAPQKS